MLGTCRSLVFCCGAWVPLLNTNRSNSQPLCILSDVAVFLDHPNGRTGTPAHDGSHYCEWCSTLKHPSTRGVSQVMKPALHTCIVAGSLPSLLERTYGFAGIGVVGASTKLIA